MNRILWDMAGVDGLEVAQSLFGEEVGYLAPFQSLETVVQGKECSVLRLCDRNFRIVYSGSLDRLRRPPQSCVWLKQYSWLSAVTLPIGRLPILLEKATVKAPHRLANLPDNQAVPARLNNIAVLIWRHLVQGRPAVEVHVSRTDLDRLAGILKQSKGRY